MDGTIHSFIQFQFRNLHLVPVVQSTSLQTAGSIAQEVTNNDDEQQMTSSTWFQTLDVEAVADFCAFFFLGSAM